MAPSAADKPPSLLQFGVFEVDLRQGELRKHGRKIKLQDLPFQFLAALLERPGEVVTREELARKLWSGALVDFDSGLNTAARKLREALDDDAGTPRYVETLPRRGYRFIAPVQVRRLHLAPVPQLVEPLPELPSPPSPRRRWPYFGMLAAAAVVLLIPVYRLSVPVRTPRVLDVVQLTQSGRAEIADGLATDGSRVYFVERTGGRWRLAQVSVHGGAAQLLPLAKPLNRPDILDISPDRSSLLLMDPDGTGEDHPFWVLPAVGGTPRRVGDARGSHGGWSRDGSRVIFARGSALFQISSDGSDSRKLVDTSGSPVCIRCAPSPQPDVLRFGLVDPDMRALALWEVSSAGAGLHLLLPDWTPLGKYPDGADCGIWLASGKFYAFRSQRGPGTGIWAMRAGRGLLAAGSQPVLIYSAPQRLGMLAAAPDGKRMFFAAGQDRRELVRYDSRRGQFLPYLPGVSARWISFSKDGQWVTYTTVPQDTLWRSREDGSEPVQLTTNISVFQPRWSPDGKWIAFSGGPSGQNSKAYVIPAAGGALDVLSRATAALPYADGDASWSPDGNSLVFGRSLPDGVPGPVGLYVMDWKTRTGRFLPGSEKLSRAAWSPNPQYLAALGQGSLQLFDFKTGQWTPLASGAGLGVPFWSRDGQYVYYQEVLGSPEQPIFRVQIHTRKIDRMMDSSRIPQSNLTGYGLSGMAPGDEPVATVARTNSDIYALDLELP
jgi:DNA-binding winged helix-turn-helix (wHTH) protein/Tol biopolymer transport system component